MNVVIDINHPAHVHFFRPFLGAMRERGHELLVTASRKDVALDLLAHYGIEHITLPSYGGSVLRKAASVPLVDVAMWRAVRRFRPHYILGIASARAAHAAFFLRGCRSWIFDDTEHAVEQIYLYLPFADRVFTPSCFTRNLGRKHVRYPGYHELAYLHPDRYTPDRAVLQESGIGANEPLFIVRFVAWEASHDVGQRGLTAEGKRRLVDELAKLGRVVLSSEGPLPPEYEQYRMTLPVEKIHDLLAFSTLYVGEGATMASEAAVLGVPAVYVNTIGAGTIAEQEQYGLLHHITDEPRAIETALRIAGEPDRQRYEAKRQRLLAEKCDVTGWMVDQIEEDWRARG